MNREIVRGYHDDEQPRRRAPTKKTKTRYSKIIVVLVITLNALFTAAVLFLFLKTGSEPVTLIGAWFAFTTVELWQLATIKKKESDADGTGTGDAASGAHVDRR